MPRYSHPDDIETFQDACKATFQNADNAMQRFSAYLAQHERKRANQRKREVGTLASGVD